MPIPCTAASEKAAVAAGLGLDPARLRRVMVKCWVASFPALDRQALARYCATVQAELRTPEIPPGLMRQLLALAGL